MAPCNSSEPETGVCFAMMSWVGTHLGRLHVRQTSALIRYGDSWRRWRDSRDASEPSSRVCFTTMSYNLGLTFANDMCSKPSCSLDVVTHCDAL